MSYLELDDSFDRFGLVSDYSTPGDGPGIAGSRETLESDPDGPALTEIPGRVRGPEVSAEPDPGSTAAAHLRRAGAGPPAEAG